MKKKHLTVLRARLQPEVNHCIRLTMIWRG